MQPVSRSLWTCWQKERRFIPNIFLIAPQPICFSSAKWYCLCHRTTAKDARVLQWAMLPINSIYPCLHLVSDNRQVENSSTNTGTLTVLEKSDTRDMTLGEDKFTEKMKASFTNTLFGGNFSRFVKYPETLHFVHFLSAKSLAESEGRCHGLATLEVFGNPKDSYCVEEA